MEAEESVVNNPVKMSKIRHQLEAELAAKDERKRAKREAKKAKKEAKKVLTVVGRPAGQPLFYVYFFCVLIFVL